MATYSIEPTRENLHGKFSRDYAPVLTINSGDTVRFSTLDASWFVSPPTDPDDRESGQKFQPFNPQTDSGHALCGPIAINGAQPGMTLAVTIDALRPANWGWNAGGGPIWISERLGFPDFKTRQRLLWALDPDGLTGTDQFGRTVKLRPFLGVMGMPPDEPGLHSTAPPRITGGNLDCKALVPGSTLYLPVAVPGGLFSTGDGHAAQGDGEISGTAIECGMELAELTFTLLPDLRLSTPRANTPEGWLTFGLHEDLNEATFIAVSAMLDLMHELYGFELRSALALASTCVDLRITQVVNGVMGVHAVLPHDAFTLEGADA